MPSDAADRVRRLRRQAEEVLDRLRPGLLADGGNVELASVDEAGAVTLMLQGACARCPARLATLRLVIEPALRREIAEIAHVIPGEPVGP